MAESYDYESVVEAVMKFGVDKWDLIGAALEMTDAEITAVTHDRPSPAGKLKAVISCKRYELGDQMLVKQLLEACGKIPQPILGIVKQHLDCHPRRPNAEEASDSSTANKDAGNKWSSAPSRVSRLINWLSGNRSHTLACGRPPFPRQIGPISTVIGREKELSIIKSYFQTKGSPDTDSPIIQIISAGAGMGKTDLAFQYARINKKSYSDGTFFFFLESRMTFAQSVKDNLVAIGLQPSGSSSENFIRLQSYVESHPRCLFLYDNADDISILDGHLPTTPLHLLVTTRRHSFYSLRLKHANVLALEQLQSDSAIQLLLGQCHHPLSLEQLQQEYSNEYEHARNVVGPRMLCGLPLGIVHAATMLREQYPQEKDRLKQFSATLEKNKGQLSMEPRCLEDWLRNYHLSGIQAKLESEMSVSSLDDIRSLMKSTIKNSSLTPNEVRAILDARDDLINCPLMGPWKMDIKSVCDRSLLAKPVLQAASLLPSRDIPVFVLNSYVEMVFGYCDEKQFTTTLYMMHERSLLKWSENRQSFTLHPLIQQTIQQYIVDQNNERQSVLSCLSETLIKLLPSLKEIQTRHKLTDANVTKYGSHLYHLASLILDCHCDSLVTQSAVDLACELSLQMQNLSVAETLCFGRLQTDRRRGNKKRLVQALVHTARVCALQHKACVAHLLCQSALQLLWERPAACGHTTEQWAFMMLEVAHAYEDLRNIAKLESVAIKTKGVLEAHGLTKCYVFAVCKRKLSSSVRHNHRVNTLIKCLMKQIETGLQEKSDRMQNKVL